MRSRLATLSALAAAMCLGGCNPKDPPGPPPECDFGQPAPSRDEGWRIDLRCVLATLTAPLACRDPESLICCP